MTTRATGPHQLGYPVDAVVTTEAARDFLRGHGYHAGQPLHLPSGLRLWPLNRIGRPASTGQTAARLNT